MRDKNCKQLFSSTRRLKKVLPTADIALRRICDPMSLHKWYIFGRFSSTTRQKWGNIGQTCQSTSYLVRWSSKTVPVGLKVSPVTRNHEDRDCDNLKRSAQRQRSSLGASVLSVWSRHWSRMRPSIASERPLRAPNTRGESDNIRRNCKSSSYLVRKLSKLVPVSGKVVPSQARSWEQRSGQKSAPGDLPAATAWRRPGGPILNAPYFQGGVGSHMKSCEEQWQNERPFSVDQFFSDIRF